MPTEKREFIAQVTYYNDDGTEMTEEQREVYINQRAEEFRKREAEHQARLKRQEYEASIDGQIEKAMEAIEQAKENWQNLLLLKEKYPDARKHNSRGPRIYQSSPSANPLVTHCTITQSCSCCIDAVIFAYPYLKDPQVGEICSEPHRFTVGQGSYSGEYAYEGWEKQMREANISEAVIEQVKQYFEKQEEEEQEYD